VLRRRVNRRGDEPGSIVISPTRFGKRPPGVIFVTSQGLYYDTFVVADSRDAAVPADSPA
jgi:hypothetical protein